MNFRSADDSDNDDTSVQSRSPIPSLPRTHINNNNNNNIPNNNNNNNNNPQNNNYFSGSGSYYSSSSSMAGTAVSHQQYQNQQNNRNNVNNTNVTNSNSIFGNLLANIPNSWSILELLNLGGSTNNTLGGIVLSSSSASPTSNISGTSSKSPTTTTTTTTNNNVKKLTPTTTATTTSTTSTQQQQQQQPSKTSLEVSIVVRHFTGDFRQFTVPHADFSIREIKETYIATLDKMPPKDLQEFLAHAQTQIEHFKRRRHYFTASPNNVLNTRNNSSVVNNNSFSGMSYTGNNFHSVSENNNYSNRINSGGNQFFSPPSTANNTNAGGTGSTRHSGFLGKSFSNIKLNINDINFASRDGHILQDFEKISSLKKMDSVQSYLELYVVPLLLHKREEPLLVVSPLFPLPTSSTSNSNNSTSNANNNNNNNVFLSSSPSTLDQNTSACGGNPIIIREYDFSNAILQVNNQQQNEQNNNNNNNSGNGENGAAGCTPRKTQSQNINEVKFATTTLSQMNSSNSLLSQEQKTQSNSPKSETTPSNNIHAENSNITPTPTTTQNQNASSNNNTSNNNTTLRELTIREVSISPADLARKRASGLGNDNEHNNQNKSVDCGDLIVHVHPASHVLVIEHNNINSSSSSPSSASPSSSSPKNPGNSNNLHQQQSLQVKCVDHFCKFISVHNNNNNINNSGNNNINKSGQKFTSVTTPSKMSSPNRVNNINVSSSSSKPPLSNTSAGHNNDSSPTSVAGAGGLPPLASTNNNNNNNNEQQQQQGAQEQNNNNNFPSQNQIFSCDRSLQYFSSQHWSPVHAWVSPDGNFVIVHIVEKEESSTSTSFGGLPLHINNPFTGGISSTSHPHHSHTHHNQPQSNHKTATTNSKINGNTNNNGSSSNNNSSTVFLVFESAARGSSWLCRGAFRMPFLDITISGWACENRFVLCVGLTHCVVRVEVEGEVSIQCSTLVKETLTKSNNTNNDNNNNHHENEASGGNPSSSSFAPPSVHSLPNSHSNTNTPSPSSRFAPPLQIVRTLHTYMDGTLMWYDSKRALLKICHPAASLAAAMKLLEQNIQLQQQQQGGSSSFGASSSLMHHSVSGSSLVKDDQHQRHLSSSPSASSVHGVGPTMSKLSSSTVNTDATSSIASSISSNPLIQTMENHLSNVGFAIHFKRRVNHAQAQNYNFLLQSRPPHWQQHHQQLLSSSLPRLVLSPGEDGRFQGFCSVSNESNIIGNNNNNNSSSSTIPALPIPLSTTKATPQAIYFLHKLNLIETAPDLPNEAFIAMFPKYLIYVSEHPIVPSFAQGGNNASSPTANNNNSNNTSISASNNNNVMREDRFVISYVYPPIVPGNVVCCQYAKPTTLAGFARLRVVYCHDDDTTGETTLHVVVLQAEWKDVKNVNNPLNFVHVTSGNGGAGENSSANNNNNNNNNSSTKKSDSGATAVANNSNSSGGGLFDYLKKKISVWRGNSDDVLAANASKEAERIASATHKQIKFTSGGTGAGDDASSSTSSLSAFKHGACDCYMAAAAPVGLIVKATGSGGGIAVVRVRAGLYGS